MLEPMLECTTPVQVSAVANAGDTAAPDDEPVVSAAAFANLGRTLAGRARVTGLIAVLVRLCRVLWLMTPQV